MDTPVKAKPKMKLYGFNNLTKTLSFNIYDICYTRTEEEKNNTFSTLMKYTMRIV
ncbi:S-adenosylmethionine decarboxylase proenzym,prokaryotic class 1A [Veillonella parvula HSIVP1]|nr:S-adenosylmethionine decarboxylase proenzym,prokaryotic class 1A [Veillonella parvula HSIVP1]